MIGPYFFRTRLAKGAVFVGVKIWKGFPRDPVTNEILERGYIWRAELNGEGCPISDVMIEYDGVTGIPVISDDRIDEVEYVRLSMVADHAKKYMPTDPFASPRKAIDMNALPPIQW